MTSRHNVKKHILFHTIAFTMHAMMISPAVAQVRQGELTDNKLASKKSETPFQNLNYSDLPANNSESLWDATETKVSRDTSGKGTLEVSRRPLFSLTAPAIITGFFGFIAVMIAYFQFKRTHDQREYQFDRKQLDDQFSDIQDRLSDESRVVRANAAHRLAKMAQQCQPGIKNNNSPEHFPFFTMAVSQLSTALYLEEDVNVRSSVVESLGILTIFAESRGTPFLSLIINKLTESNRVTKTALIRALGEYWIDIQQSKEKSQETLINQDENQQLEVHLQIAMFTGLLPDPVNLTHSAQMIALLLETSDATTAGKTFQASYQALDEDDQKKKKAELLPALRQRSDQLKASRDALAVSLAALDRTIDHASDEINKNNARMALQQIFLFEANLFGVNLSGADLSGSNFFGATLTKANLNGVELSKAHLNQAILNSAKLRGAWLRRTQLHEAKLLNSHLQKADLSGANLSGANLSGANLFGADLRGADLTRANLQKADLREANMSGAILTDADLREAEVWHANILETRGTPKGWAFLSFDSPQENKENLPDYELKEKLRELWAEVIVPPQGDEEDRPIDEQFH